MPFDRIAQSPKYKELFFPLSLGYTEEEWYQKIQDYLKTDQMNGETVICIQYGIQGEYVIFWTQEFVVSIKSVYEETYNGNYDDFEYMCLQRNPSGDVVVP